MPCIGLLGRLTILRMGSEVEVEWTIPDIDTLLSEDGAYYEHPGYFYFEGKEWFLKMWPNKKSDRNSSGHIDVALHRWSSRGPSIRVAFTLSLKTMKGEKLMEKQGAGVFEGLDRHSIDRFLSREEYRRRKSEFLSSSGLLTFVCTLKRFAESATEECSHCTETFHVLELSSHEKKCRIKCPECLGVVLLKNWPDHKCPIPRAEAFEKRTHNYKTLMLSGDHSDVIVKVQNAEFRLHKIILAAQNSYFDAMFKNDMKETSTGIVKIEDCDPDIFLSFIFFVYTGVADEISSENACKLYKAADMYQEDQLKKECLHFLLNSFSVDSFCDYFVLAWRYDEKELFQKAVDFFISKQKDITCTVQWQTFLEEYPTQAIELLNQSILSY